MEFRNVCIIAHVDHGKTTLVDHLLRQGGTFRSNQVVEERVMDSMDLEREKGITIRAKNTSVRLGDLKINIVDTPGHADFGGEVERILGMVDGAILLVDAAEGPLPQTRFVLQKAIQQKLAIALVLNKVDRPEVQGTDRMQEVINQTFDLFVELGASETQLDFPILYACARQGWCTTNEGEIADLLADPGLGSLRPLFDLIRDHVPPPAVNENTKAFQMQVAHLDYSEYVGRLAIGRVFSGEIKKGARITCQGADGNQDFSIARLEVFEGLKTQEVNEVTAGDIALIAGNENVEIGDTLTNNKELAPLPRIVVDPPTLGMVFSVNDSPLSGQEGEAIQSRKLRDRLVKETRHNVALRLEERNGELHVLGRGELQFAILIEQLRREGLEFTVGKPRVLFKKEEEQLFEPIERAVLDLPEESGGEVTQLFQRRKGRLMQYDTMGARIRLVFEIPTRGLLGIRSHFLSLTRGSGLLASELKGYEPFMGELLHRTQGALVSDRAGEAVEYALLTLEDRGTLFVTPGTKVYEGMIIGEGKIENDLNVNPCKEKKLTNMRAAHAEVLVTLKGTRQLSLEQCLEWIDEDEAIEITPQSIRLRKRTLATNLRGVKRLERIEKERRSQAL